MLIAQGDLRLVVHIVFLEAVVIQYRRLFQPLEHKFAEEAVDLLGFLQVLPATLADAFHFTIGAVEIGWQFRDLV